jgi:NAD(P)-dependent dehydrogenase (short-subunit alcohol dehydrogenase family)
MITVKDKIIVVVGGTGKVGFPIVRNLLESGAIVISVSRNLTQSEFLINDLSPTLIKRHYHFCCDVSSPLAIESLKTYLIDNHLLPDVLINALSYRPLDKYLSDSVEKWDEVVSKNSRSIYILFKTFADLISTKGGGSVINISTIYAVVAPDPDLYLDLNMGTEADYPFIKGGSISLTRYFASYYAEKKVRFNSIILGGVFNNQPEEFVRRYIKKVPLGRMASADDIFGIILLLSSFASSYVTGVSIPVDGGYTLR